jgi:hypothetical protein
MGKLQMIKRSNGSESYSSNIPLPMIKDLLWEKGDKLSLEVGKVRNRNVIIIFNDGYENGRD